MDREDLYRRLPPALQNMAVSLEGWRVRRSRYDARFASLLREYEGRTFASGPSIRAFRDDRLRRFVRHAADTIPHYRRLFSESGLDPGEFRALSDLSRLPVLERSLVQAGTDDFVSPSVRRRECMMSHTSGTTGAGLRFPVTLEAHREQWAVWWRYRSWHGIPPDRPCLYFAGRSVVPLGQRRPPFWRYNRPGKQVLFSGYHLSETNAPSYLAEMSRHPGAWIHGYPSLISLLASFALQLDFRPDVDRVTVGAESLLPHQAATIERAFGRRPLQHYGMAEGVANVSECPEGRLHVDEDYSAVEFVPLDGDQFRIVGTNFTNPAMALLRYDTGDVCSLEDGECSCGRPGRLVRAIDGRKEDYVITHSGARLGRLDHIFKDLVRIREAQIRQRLPGEMIVVVVKGAGYSDADEKHLRHEIRKRVGDDVKFDIEYVERLPRTSTGKIRLVVSAVGEGQLVP